MRKPDFRTQHKLVMLWHKAQKGKDVERMEALMDPKFLNVWWHVYISIQSEGGAPVWKRTCLDILNVILVRAGLVADRERSPRLSEIVMAQAWKDIPKQKVCPNCCKNLIKANLAAPGEICQACHDPIFPK